MCTQAMACDESCKAAVAWPYSDSVGLLGLGLTSCMLRARGATVCPLPLNRPRILCTDEIQTIRLAHHSIHLKIRVVEGLDHHTKIPNTRGLDHHTKIPNTLGSWAMHEMASENLFKFAKLVKCPCKSRDPQGITGG